jgi:Zn-dependent M28 family amino/carboxypeptidase
VRELQSLLAAIIVTALCYALSTATPAVTSKVPTQRPAGDSTPTSTRIATTHSAPDREEVNASRLMAHVAALSDLPTRHVTSSTVGDAARYIHDQFEAASGRLVVSEQEFAAEFNGFTTDQVNVIATLPGGGRSEEIIVVGAHYDSRTLDLRDFISRAPGANDNASGVAVVLELAHILANERPDLTIQLVAFSAEEIGRQGSIQFVRAAESRGDVFRGMIALDIVGHPDGDEDEWSVRVFSAGPDDSESRRIAKALHDQADVFDALTVLVQDAVDRPNRYSDHVSFSEEGFPAIRLMQLEEDDHNHSVDDTIDSVNPEYLKKVAELTLLGIDWLESHR